MASSSRVVASLSWAEFSESGSSAFKSLSLSVGPSASLSSSSLPDTLSGPSTRSSSPGKGSSSSSELVGSVRACVLFWLSNQQRAEERLQVQLCSPSCWGAASRLRAF